MAADELVEFGARRAFFDTPEVRRSDAGIFAIPLAGLLRALNSPPRVDLTKRQIVLGRTIIPFQQIDRARLEVDSAPGGREIGLRFGTNGGPQMVAPLRAGDRLTLTPEQRQAVLAILRASHIVMPSSHYDPTGSFARWNFPANVTREQAIELVTNPPGPRDPLPIPPTW